MILLTGLGRLFLWHIKLNVSRAIMYRFNFLMELISSIFISGMGPFVLFLYFSKTQGFPGWTLAQIFLFQGILLFWVGLRDLLFGDIQGSVIRMVWKGDFDRLLLKPYPPIGVLLCSGFKLNGIGSCIAGCLVTGLALSGLQIYFSIWQLPLLLLLLISGILLYMAILVIYSSIIILLIQISRIDQILAHILNFANYPINIFPAAIRVAMITFLPFAVWTYYPAQVLLNRADMGIAAAAVGSAALFWFSLVLWNRCLKMYTSAGG